MPKSNEIERMEITIIGGGAAGMTAAISAARVVGGNQVRILEKNDKLGRKLLATGNGRCNFTNTLCTYSDLKSVSEFDRNNSSFSKDAFSIFGIQDTLNFFEEIGVLWREETEGRIYPYSEQASAVQEALKAELEYLGVDIIYSSNVTSIRKLEEDKKSNCDNIVGFEIILETGMRLKTQKIIIATGGKAGSQYGSTGEGYRIAKSLGHSLVKPIPALVQLTSDDKLFQQLKGVRSKGKVTLRNKNQEDIVSETGEIQFTEEGLSGICIFNLSRYLRVEEKDKTDFQNYFVRIDFFQDSYEEELFQKLSNRANILKNRKKDEFLNGILNKKLAPVILKTAGIKLAGAVGELTEGEIIKLTKVLKCWEIQISGTKGWKEAQVTSGGIKTSEIEKKTMESKLINGLYFAGELIDVDGKCGGYNLQWAWTSGFIAGKSASQL